MAQNQFSNINCYFPSLYRDNAACEFWHTQSMAQVYPSQPQNNNEASILFTID